MALRCRAFQPIFPVFSDYLTKKGWWQRARHADAVDVPTQEEWQASSDSSPKETSDATVRPPFGWISDGPQQKPGARWMGLRLHTYLEAHHASLALTNRSETLELVLNWAGSNFWGVAILRPKHIRHWRCALAAHISGYGLQLLLRLSMFSLPSASLTVHQKTWQTDCGCWNKTSVSVSVSMNFVNFLATRATRAHLHVHIHTDMHLLHNIVGVGVYIYIYIYIYILWTHGEISIPN